MKYSKGNQEKRKLFSFLHKQFFILYASMCYSRRVLTSVLYVLIDSTSNFSMFGQ